MSNFYYVKEGGSATGDAGRVATTPSTGSFATKGAAAYYTSISAALAATTPPADGDLILCSSAHNHNYGANTTLTMPTGVVVVSVADANCDQYAAGAHEQCTGASTYDLILASSTNHVHWGMKYTAADTIVPNGNCTFMNCELLFGQSGSGPFGPNANDFRLVVIGGTLSAGATGTSYISITTRGVVELYGVVMTLTAGARTNLIAITSGGARCVIDHCTTPAATNLVSANSSSNVVIANSLLGAYTNIHNGTLPGGSKIFIEGCSTANLENSDFSLSTACTVTTDASIYRAGQDPDGKNWSYKFVTSATCGVANPFRKKIATKWVNTASAKTFTVEIDRDNATALKDGQIWLEVIHSDDTTVANHVETDRGDIMGGTAQTSSSASWTGTGGWANENKQKLAVTTAQTGKAGLVTCWINIIAASQTLYVCPQVDVT